MPERNAIEQNAPEWKPTGRKSSERKSSERKSSERKSSERKFSERKSSERKSSEWKAAGRKMPKYRSAGRKIPKQKKPERKMPEPKTPELNAELNSTENESLEDLEEKIGYKFKKRELLKMAMTHSSYSGGKKRGSNERLEFLGDSVLQVTVSQFLYMNMTTVPEGGLTKLRASIVCENSLYEFSKRISLGNYILLGKGEEMTGGRDRRSILADAFEAMIAAVYIDGGLNAAMDVIMRFMPSIDALRSGKVRLGDYKTILQEIIQKNPEEKISYEVEETSGKQHKKVFFANVMLNGQTIGSGSGFSKKEAEQEAAKEAILLMGYDIG